MTSDDLHHQVRDIQLLKRKLRDERAWVAGTGILAAAAGVFVFLGELDMPLGWDVINTVGAAVAFTAFGYCLASWNGLRTRLTLTRRVAGIELALDAVEEVCNAQQVAEEKYPSVDQRHHHAFVNSVVYALTGYEPRPSRSMREHWAARVVENHGVPGEFTVNQAVALVEEICYGPLTLEIARVSVEVECVEDPPGDKEEAARLLMQAGAETN